jgi:hypothetical protein
MTIARAKVIEGGRVAAPTVGEGMGARCCAEWLRHSALDPTASPPASLEADMQEIP